MLHRLLPLAFACVTTASAAAAQSPASDSVLRHVVLFAWKPEATPAQLAEVDARFAALQDSVPDILAFEHGRNNSPEGLDKGFTHAYVATFPSAAARDAYLPHPAHVRFTELLPPILADVLVVDYWAPAPE